MESRFTKSVRFSKSGVLGQPAKLQLQIVKSLKTRRFSDKEKITFKR